MPNFNYTAMKGKEKVTGKLSAENIKEVREALRRLNLLPIKIEEQLTEKAKQEKKINFNSLNMREKIDLTNTLAILSKTGISLIESLIFLELNSESLKVRALVADLKKHILAGSNFSEAVTKYPHVFDRVYTGLIAAGEQSGEIDTTLERIVYLLNKRDKLVGKVRSAMMYPCFVIVLAGLVTTIMLTFVFPTFKDMYDNMGKQLPMITSVLMNIGIFLKTYWFIIPINLGLTVFGIYKLFTWETSKRIIDRITLKIPIINTFFQYVALSNFLSVFKIAFDAGVPIIDSLLLSIPTVGNLIIRDKLKDASFKIQYGQSLSAALKQSDVIPAIIMCMISTGEQAGKLGELLQQSSEYVDEQIDNTVDTLNKFIEPILLVVIGGIVLVLALALYLPMFQSYSNIT